MDCMIITMRLIQGKILCMLMDASGAQDWHLTFSSVDEDLISVLPRSLGSIFACAAAVYLSTL